MKEMDDDTIIDTIYCITIVHESFNKLIVEYRQAERRTLCKIFKQGKDSNEFHYAFFYENGDRNITIDRKTKKNSFNIVRSIQEFSHVHENDDAVVFDFDLLLVNMTAADAPARTFRDCSLTVRRTVNL